MAPASETAHGTPGPNAAAPAQNGGAAAGKLQAGSGAAMAAAAAQQAKVRRKQQELQDLLQAALAKPAERSKQQVDCLVEFMWGASMLKSLQPTCIRSIAQAVEGRLMKEGDTLYTQGDPAQHFFLLVAGSVAMLEADAGDCSTELEMRRVGMKECFGGDELLENLPRAQTARCVAHTGAHASTAASANDKTVGELPPLVLLLSADDYRAMLEGRHSKLLEEKVLFLEGLPALKGLGSNYLQGLAHCFHETDFAPKEMIVRQGDASDCMYIIKTGQVCVMIDPGYVVPTVDVHATEPAAELDIKKLVQVCMLGGGAIIGDMSLQDHGARRSATVIALTEVVAYRVPLVEFKRRMPQEILEGMHRIAGQKQQMNDGKVKQRNKVLASGVGEGYVLLGARVVKEEVLHGHSLRSLSDGTGKKASSISTSSKSNAPAAGSGTRSSSSGRGGAHSTGGSTSSGGGKATGVLPALQQLLDSWGGTHATAPDEYTVLLREWGMLSTAARAPPKDATSPSAAKQGPNLHLPQPRSPSHEAGVQSSMSSLSLAAGSLQLHLMEQHTLAQKRPQSALYSPGSPRPQLQGLTHAHSLPGILSRSSAPSSPQASRPGPLLKPVSIFAQAHHQEHATDGSVPGSPAAGGLSPARRTFVSMPGVWGTSAGPSSPASPYVGSQSDFGAAE